MITLYIKGTVEQAVNAAYMRGFTVLGSAWPLKSHTIKVNATHSDGLAVYEWMGEGPGKGPYEPGTLLWFKHCD